jgi:hypothetical protein
MAYSTSPVPGESRRPVAVIGALMPHLHPGRHHVYRDVSAPALLAALVAAGLGFKAALADGGRMLASML